MSRTVWGSGGTSTLSIRKCKGWGLGGKNADNKNADKTRR